MNSRKVLVPKPLLLTPSGCSSGHILSRSFGKETSNLQFGWNQGLLHLLAYLDGKFGTKLPGTCEPPLRQLQNTSDGSLPDVNTHNWVLMMKARRALPAITSKTPGRRGEVFTLFSLMHDLSFIQEALRGSSSKPGCRGECRGWVTAWRASAGTYFLGMDSSPGGSMVKNPPVMQGMLVWALVEELRSHTPQGS